MGNERLLYEEQARTFHSVSHMMGYVENNHLSKQLVDQRIIYHHPMCKAKGLVLNSVMHFKNLVVMVYKITLQLRFFS
jgi:hypothetical protein